MSSTATNELPPRTLKIHRIHTPASAADTARFAQLRLAALRTNPEAFSSTYADALRFTAEEWEQRVNTPGRITVVAQLSTYTKNEADESISGADGKQDWLGTLSTLDPSFLVNDPTAIPRVPRLVEGIEAGRILCYLLVGMWVHPSARRKGAGRMLIRAVLDIIRDDPYQDDDGAASGRTKIVFLEVHEVNTAARALYEHMGFEKEEDAEGVDEGHILMSITI